MPKKVPIELKRLKGTHQPGRDAARARGAEKRYDKKPAAARPTAPAPVDFGALPPTPRAPKDLTRAEREVWDSLAMAATLAGRLTDASTVAFKNLARAQCVLNRLDPASPAYNSLLGQTRRMLRDFGLDGSAPAPTPVTPTGSSTAPSGGQKTSASYLDKYGRAPEDSFELRPLLLAALPDGGRARLAQAEADQAAYEAALAEESGLSPYQRWAQRPQPADEDVMRREHSEMLEAQREWERLGKGEKPFQPFRFKNKPADELRQRELGNRPGFGPLSPSGAAEQRAAMAFVERERKAGRKV